MTTLTILSDTHGLHERVEVPAADVAIHCGDFTRGGNRWEVESFVDWFRNVPAAHRIVVAGNHDSFCEEAPDEMRTLCADAGLTYLVDERVEVAGLSIWGSPVTPAFMSLAFNRERGDSISAHWDHIPEGLDVLVTHGPPRGLGDRTLWGQRVGCDDLLAAVKRARPRLHVFGHIHEAAGEYQLDGLDTRFVNAATKRWVPRRVRRAVRLTL